MSSQTSQKTDHLTSAKHARPVRRPRTVDELVHEKHVEHMKRIDQAGWLKKLFQKADLMKAEQKRKSSAPQKTKTTGRKKS